jgi:hypothetical protein
MEGTSAVWKPDESLFDLVNGELRGILRVKEQLANGHLNTKKIVTSRDPSVVAMLDALETKAMPSGFIQHQLPILLPGDGAMYFITRGQANAKFPKHSHDRDDGLRVILDGSLIYDGVELFAGDWFYVPRGCAYEFQVGKNGCSVFHAYAPPPNLLERPSN